jgi:hypothetical protein
VDLVPHGRAQRAVALEHGVRRRTGRDLELQLLVEIARHLVDLNLHIGILVLEGVAQVAEHLEDGIITPRQEGDLALRRRPPCRLLAWRSPLLTGPASRKQRRTQSCPGLDNQLSAR